VDDKISISEGSDVYGSDGRHGGRVEAVGAKYVTIAAGLLGQKEFHLPLALIARADAERVDLALPLVDAQAQAFKVAPPPDEPIYQESRPIPEEERGAVGIPVAQREDFGIGTRRSTGE
jgi:hypothetical protein